MSPRQQMRLRLLPYGIALGLFVCWMLLLFLWRATTAIDVLKDFKVEVPGFSIPIPNFMADWRGWVAPYFAIAIAVMLRWPSRWGWLWTLILCIISDLVALVLLLMQIVILNVSQQDQFPLPAHFFLLTALCALVLIILQILAVSLVLCRRLFFARQTLRP